MLNLHIACLEAITVALNQFEAVSYYRSTVVKRFSTNQGVVPIETSMLLRQLIFHKSGGGSYSY